MRRSPYRVSGAMLLLAMSNSGFTQSTSTLEEVIVTATKRETTVQSTPMSISAFTGEQLQDRGVNDIRRVAESTPGLWIGADAGSGTVPIVIRGIGSLLGGLGSDEAVSVYVDGVIRGRAGGSVFEFVDVDRVEVLRGPQGTLYGRNATGGAINIITKTPGEKFEARVEGELSNYGGYGLRGYTLIPVSDTLGLKFAGGYFDRDGYVRNITRNREEAFVKKEYFSAGLNWRPSDRTTVDIRGMAGESVIPLVPKNANDGIADTYTVPSAFPNDSRRKFYSAGVTLSHEFNGFTGKAILGYGDTEVPITVDSDGIAAEIVQFRDLTTSQQTSAEFQLISNNDSRLRWLVGLYYYDESAEQFTTVNANRNTASPLGIIGAAREDTTSWAGFGEVSYQATDKLEFTLGARYSRDSKDWQNCLSFAAFTLFEVNYDPRFCDTRWVPDQDDWSATTPRFVVEYKANDDVLIYASATKGYRAGGWNRLTRVIVGQNNGFDPEFVTSYEVGVKSEFSIARFNVAGSFSDYKDLQVRATHPTGLITTTNAAAATIYSIEAELTLAPTDRLNFNGSVAWLDAEYDNFIDGNRINRSGFQLNRAPPWTFNASAEYHFNFAGGKLTPAIEWKHVDEMFHDETNRQPAGSESFNMLNVRLRFESADGQWGAQAYMNNANDTVYRAHSFQGFTPAIVPAYYNEPRTYGVTAFRRF